MACLKYIGGWKGNYIKIFKRMLIDVSLIISLSILLLPILLISSLPLLAFILDLVIFEVFNIKVSNMVYLIKALNKSLIEISKSKKI